jgi:hypothetical protein
MASVYIEKDIAYRNIAIRQSARDAQCTVHSPFCRQRHDTCVWAHSPFPEHGKAGGLKAHDHAGCYACQDCHAFLDGGWTTHRHWTRDKVKALFCDAMVKSLLILLRKGVLK